MNDKPQLRWGLREAVPDNARAAWGARLIVNQDGYVDIVPDRIDTVGDEVELVALLGRALPFEQMLDRVSALLKAGVMDTRKPQQFSLLTDGQVEVRADTKASAGYCYVAAWLKPQADR